MLDKYGVGQDPYCYPGTMQLRNLLHIQHSQILAQAERALSENAASTIEFSAPPYDLPYLQNIHRVLFADLYDWAGALRTVDISKDETHFCVAGRVKPEADKLFTALAKADWYQGFDRASLVPAVAEMFGDLNVVHPFREGNGRAQRILFEHIIVNAGFSLSWWEVEMKEWTQANIDAVVCDYTALQQIFERCIGEQIAE